MKRSVAVVIFLVGISLLAVSCRTMPAVPVVESYEVISPYPIWVQGITSYSLNITENITPQAIIAGSGEVPDDLWYKPQPPEVREVPVEVIKEVPVIITQNVTIPYREWQSLEEFEFIFKGSTTPVQPNVCLSTAESLQRIALEQGYPVSIALAMNGEYYGRYVTSPQNSEGGHAGLLVDIQDVWYFVDPVPWKITKLW